jgi:tetratricopeptide (TPR) repeat protein
MSLSARPGTFRNDTPTIANSDLFVRYDDHPHGACHMTDKSASPEPTPERDPASEVSRLVEEVRARWDLPDPETPLRAALEIAQRHMGLDHPLVARVLSHLGWHAWAREQQNDAVAHFRRAVAILRETSLDSSKPETLDILVEIAGHLEVATLNVKLDVDLDERGSETDWLFDEADGLRERAIAGYDAMGRDDPNLADLIAKTGWCRYFHGRHKEAEPLLVRALTMRRRLLGPGDHETARRALSLATAYDRAGFDVDPEPYYRQALSGFKETLPDHHPSVLETLGRLAIYLCRVGRQQEAAPFFDRMVEIFLADGAVIDWRSIDWRSRDSTLDECCQYLRDTGRENDAEAVERLADTDDSSVDYSRAHVEQVESIHGADSLELAEALGRRAYRLAWSGLVEECEESARRVLAILQARLGPDDPATVYEAMRLIRVREIAEKKAAKPRRPRRRGRMEPRLFYPEQRPWLDERRADLIRAYLKSVADDEPDDPTGAIETVGEMTIMRFDPEEQWEFILELIAEAPNNEHVLQDIAAGLLGAFLDAFSEDVIDWVEAQAELDPKFRRVLSGVWKHGMSNSVWQRLRTIQATVPNPLPYMIPFSGEKKVHGDDF